MVMGSLNKSKKKKIPEPGVVFSVCDTKITGEVWVYWSLSTWRGFMCLTQICGCSRLSNHWSIRCPCFCFGSACGVWLWTRLLCLHIQHQRQWELPAGKRAFGILSSAELCALTLVCTATKERSCLILSG